MTTLIHSDAVAYYAAQVRAALDGLDQETVNELTDGLEADLSEAVLDEVDLAAGESPSAVLASLEADGLVQRFGPPSEYARELAAAADVVIPASVESDRVSKVQAIRDLGSDVRVWWDGFLQRHRWLSELGGLVASLRPVWWLARGWGLYFFIVEGWFSWEYVPRTAPGWAFLGVAVLASIQFGRGKLWRSRWWRILGIGASVIAVCGLISGLWGFPDWVRSLGAAILTQQLTPPTGMGCRRGLTASTSMGPRPRTCSSTTPMVNPSKARGSWTKTVAGWSLPTLTEPGGTMSSRTT